MNSPNPVSTPNPLMPSNAVMAGAGVGTALAEIVVWFIETVGGFQVPSLVSVAIGTVLTAGIAYFANGGKAIHTA